MEPIHFADSIGGAFFAIVLIASFRALRRTPAAWAMIAGLMLRLGIIGVRYAGYQAFAREVDAKYFTDGSLSLVERGVGYYTHSGSFRYQAYLAWLRGFAGMSVTGMELIGVAVWGIVGLLLLHVIRSLVGDGYRPWPMWVFAVTPSALLFTNGILRESYETGVFVIAIIVLLRLRRTTPIGSRLPVFAASGVLSLGWVFHTAFGLAGPALLLINELVLGFRRSTRGPRQAVIYVVFAVAFLALSGRIALAFAHLDDERSEISGNAGSASYLTSVPNLGPLTLPTEIGVGYVLYVVAPLPWQLRGPVDLIAFVESVTRTAAMVLALHKRTRTETTIDLAVLAAAAQLAFSLGTVNWGTSLRHNYVSLPALVVVFVLCEPWPFAKPTRRQVGRSEPESVAVG
jgi:hypothetical protein